MAEKRITTGERVAVQRAIILLENASNSLAANELRKLIDRLDPPAQCKVIAPALAYNGYCEHLLGHVGRHHIGGPGETFEMWWVNPDA